MQDLGGDLGVGIRGTGLNLELAGRVESYGCWVKATGPRGVSDVLCELPDTGKASEDSPVLQYDLVCSEKTC